MSSPCQGVILAAGQGSRMGPLANHVPKALLPVANMPLIIRHVETLRTLGVREILIVVGHHASKIESALGDEPELGVTLRYIYQHKRHGIAHALAALEPHITAPFHLLLGDIYFEFTDLGAATDAFNNHGAAAVLAVEHDADPAAVQRNFSVELDSDGRVHRVVEKPTRTDSRCKGCGFYRFDTRIFDAIRRTPRSALRNEFELTDAIQVLIDDGAPVYGVAMTAWDINLTTPADLITCNLRMLEARGQQRLIGRNCEIAPTATLHQTILGDGARITHPIRLERCVVLPGTTVDSDTDLCDAVITPNVIAR